MTRRMAVHILTDSTSDLPEAIIREYRIGLIPLNLHFGNELLKDGEEIWAEEFYHRMTYESMMPRTSPPSVEEFVETYSSMGETGDTILSVHLSSKLSQTYHNAFEAAKRLSADRHIVVVDSGQVSMGLGWMVWEGAKAAVAGDTWEAVLKRVHQTAQAIGVFFSIDDLDPLYRTGRADSVIFPEPGTYMRPILTLEAGVLTPAEHFRGAVKRSHRRLLELLHAKMDGHPYKVAILHSDCASDAEELRSIAKNEFGAVETIIHHIGPTVGVHVGMGALGVFGLPLKP